MLYPQPAVEPACTQHTPRQGVYRHTQLCTAIKQNLVMPSTPLFPSVVSAALATRKTVSATKGNLLCSNSNIAPIATCAHQPCATVVTLQQQCRFTTCTCTPLFNSTQCGSCTLSTRTSLLNLHTKRPGLIRTLSKAVRRIQNSARHSAPRHNATL